MKDSFDVDCVVSLIRNGAFTELRDLVVNISFGDLIELISDLDKKSLDKLINLFPILVSTNLLANLTQERRDEVFALLAEENLKKVIQHNDEDEILRMIDLVGAQLRSRIEKVIPKNFLGAYKLRSKYDERNVGGHMSFSYVTMPSFWTCAQALNFIVKSVEKNIIRNKHFSRIYLTDPKLYPVGYVTLSELMACSDKEKNLGELADQDIHIIKASDETDRVSELFSRFHPQFLIVVDDFKRMVGVINHEQAINVIKEKASENVLDIGGVGESYDNSTSFFSLCFDRARWLAIALINSVFSSIVISKFRCVIEEQIALAIIMPVVASLGGNVGIQTLSVVLRSLTGGVSGSRVVVKEVMINALNGIMLGSVASLVVGIVFKSFLLGAIVASAMFFNMIWSAFIGATMPMIISKLGYDETISSGPIITSINDVFGFAIFLGIAKALL